MPGGTGKYSTIKLSTPLSTHTVSPLGGGVGKYKSIVVPPNFARALPTKPAVQCGPKYPRVGKAMMIDIGTAEFMLKNVMREWAQKMAKRMGDDARLANPSSRISVQASGMGNKVEVRATGKNAATLAFDQVMEIPPGGLKPPPGHKAWMIVKEGTVRWRSRIYQGYGGKTILRRGFLQLSWDNNFNFKNLMNLTIGTTNVSTLNLTGNLAKHLMAYGGPHLRVTAHYRPSVQLH